VAVLPTVGFALRRTPELVGLGLRVLAPCLLIAAPFIALGALVYFLLLRQHDINYYLAEQPPVFLFAAGAVATLLAVGGVLIVRRLLGWALALPILLFERTTPAEALAASRLKVDTHRWTVAAVLVSWGVGGALVGGLPLAIILFLGRLVVPMASASMALLVALMSALLSLWALLSLLVTLLTSGMFALLTVRLYVLSGIGDNVELPMTLLEEESPETGRRFTRRQLLVGLAAAVVLAVVLGYVVLDGVQTGDDVLVIAHRGAAGEAPENTLAAFALAIEQGADYVELDVQETADGEVVVIHDSDLMKVGDSSLRISEGTAEQLRAVDIGRWFAPEFTGQRVPTLAEVLTLCRGRARVIIELKYYGHNDRLEERVVEIVERLGMQDQIVTMSLKYDMVQKMKSLRPGWPAGLLTARAVGDLTTTSADFLAVNHAIASAAFVNHAHAAGKEVYVWTINDAINMSRMITLGVDGLITDFPAQAREVIVARQAMSSAERLLLAAAFYVGFDPGEPPASEDTEG
jgi:glycerophosphoryl diester phosphodiesterase